MKKYQSLKHNEEIAKIVFSRISVKDDSFIIYFKENQANKNARVCISVSKKIGNAVKRNKIKRQIRSMIDEVIDFTLKYDYVIVVRKNYLENDFSANKDRLMNTYLKIKHHKENS